MVENEMVFQNPEDRTMEGALLSTLSYPGQFPRDDTSLPRPILVCFADGSRWPSDAELLGPSSAFAGDVMLAALTKLPKAKASGNDSCSFLGRFAMQIGDKLMEGEVVNRSKAQSVYREILHQARDPALLEQSQATWLLNH